MQLEGRCGSMALRHCCASLTRLMRAAYLPQVGRQPALASQTQSNHLRSLIARPLTSLLGASSGLPSSPATAASRRVLSAAASVEAPAPAAEESAPAAQLLTLADLPTSDESEELLRIRHTVSGLT